MNNYVFYTPQPLAELLFTLLEKKTYKNVIDICCGSWNLISAAKNILKCRRIVGIDISLDVDALKPQSAVFYNEDGRIFAIKEYKNLKYDLVISNPPYGRIDNDNRIMKEYCKKNKILNTQDLRILTKRYETEMIIANMLLLADKGEMLLILPQTVLSGDSFQKMREYVCKELWLKAIIELPNGTFKNSEISTVALLFKKTTNIGCTYKYLAKYDGAWGIEKIGTIEANFIRKGLWVKQIYNYDRKTVYLFRGVIRSSQLCHDGQYRVIHNSSSMINNTWQPSIRFSNLYYPDKIVSKGDVIINRVGRFVGYWTISEYDGVGVSDCIIVLPKPSVNVIRQLMENTKKGRLDLMSRGVATKYITQKDVLFLLNDDRL